MEYLCFKVEQEAVDLMCSNDPLRAAFGKHLELISKALHDIEWVDDSDMSAGDEYKAIRTCLAEGAELQEAIVMANAAVRRLQKVIDEAEKSK